MVLQELVDHGYLTMRGWRWWNSRGKTKEWDVLMQMDPTTKTRQYPVVFVFASSLLQRMISSRIVQREMEHLLRVKKKAQVRCRWLRLWRGWEAIRDARRLLLVHAFNVELACEEDDGWAGDGVVSPGSSGGSSGSFVGMGRRKSARSSALSTVGGGGRVGLASSIKRPVATTSEPLEQSVAVVTAVAETAVQAAYANAQKLDLILSTVSGSIAEISKSIAALQVKADSTEMQLAEIRTSVFFCCCCNRYFVRFWLI